MKKLHIHISVKDLEKSTSFYRELFAAEPDKVKPDYVKWDLSNPAINFAISNQGKTGLDHLDIHKESAGNYFIQQMMKIFTVMIKHLSVVVQATLVVNSNSIRQDTKL